jgi:hypothetical protein
MHVDIAAITGVDVGKSSAGNVHSKTILHPLVDF